MNKPDIVERLRNKSGKWINGLYDEEAAAEITRLREDNKQLSDKAEALRKALSRTIEPLESFAEYLDTAPIWHATGGEASQVHALLDELRAASRAGQAQTDRPSVRAWHDSSPHN